MKPPSAASTRWAGYAALTAVLLLAAGALYFWRERMLFADASWISFQILNSGALSIQEHRYGSAITQAVPLLGMWLHLPLRVILILYSLSFPLFHSAVAALLVRWKQQPLALLLAFYLTLTISAGYYWTNNEVHQGVGWMFLFFGVVLRGPAAGWRPVPTYALALGLLFLALFTHPLLVPATAAFWVTLVLLRCPPVRGWRGVSLAVPALVFAGLRMWVSTQRVGSYDESKLHFLEHFELHTAYEAFLKPISKDFLERCWTHYYAATAIALWGLLALVRSRRWGLLLWTIAATAGLWAAISLTFDTFIPWYSESDWACLTLVAAAPFAFCVAPRLRPAPLLLVLAAVFAIRLVQIAQCAGPFEARLARLQRQLTAQRESGAPKMAVVVPDDRVFEETLLVSWALPVELMYLSALEGPPPHCTFTVLHDSTQAPADARFFHTPWYDVAPDGLNRRYYSPDTTQRYRLVPRESLPF